MVQTIVDEVALLPTDENTLCYTCKASVLVLGSNVAHYACLESTNVSNAYTHAHK